MTRAKRNHISNRLYHIQQRGHNGGEIFYDDRDRLHYMRCFFLNSSKYKLRVHGFQLLNTEVHWLVSPSNVSSISLVMQAIGREYVRSFNKRWSRFGTLWDGRYKTYWLEDIVTISLATQKFIDELSKHNGLISESIDWRWSSCGHYCGILTSSPHGSNLREFTSQLLPIQAYWELGNTPFDRQLKYREFLNVIQSEGEKESIRLALSRGRPRLSEKTLLSLPPKERSEYVALPRGRPRVK